MSFQLLNRTVFPFKNVLALKHIFCHNATMIYKFDSFWSYIGDEPDYVLTQVKDILTCHDYNYTTEQYTDVKFWLTHTNILGQEVLKFPTGLCEYVAQKTGCQIEHKKTQYDTYTGSDVLQIAQKVQKLFPGFEVRDYQKDLTLASVDKYSSMIVASVGSGKMEDKNNIIPTPDGFRRFGDLKPGDRVFGINGKPQKVLQTFEQGIQDIYRVSFRNGGYVDCGLEHLWTVRVISEKKNVTKTTKELIDSKIQTIDKRGFIARKFAVDYPLPVEYKEKEFFIDPYVLGVMIGDGCLCSTSLAISIPDMDSEIIEMVQERLNPGYVVKKDTAPVCPRYIIKKPNEDYRNKYMLEVKRLGLNVVGGKKFIPQEYFLGSVQQRKDLLSGLMDTDGTCQKRSKKSSTSFSTTSKQLAEDVASLVRSLSGWCNIRKTDRTSSGRSIEYTVIMQLDFNPFKLQRKAERFTPFRQYNYITGIEKIGQADCMCILVENKDHLYITKDYIPTHNTSVMSMLVMLWKDKRILITNNQNFILKQIYDRLLAMGVPLDEIATGTTDLTKRIVIISTQTSYNRIKDKNQEFLDYLKSVEVIINDECQHYQSVSNFSMLFYTPNLQHLVGYTGSPFRNPNKPYSNATDMTTIALFGEPAITYSMEDSIENQNIATPYSYFINYDCYKMEYMAGTDFFVQYNRSIVYNKQRNKAGIEILRFLHNNGIKTLGLFRIVKKHGLVILKELKKYGVKALFLQGGETIYECDSKLKITSRKGGIDEIKKALHEDGYNIILASQVMDEGVDISSFQCGVLFTGGKSAIKIVQQTGRVSRAKSSGENISLVIDFNDTPINRMFANQYKERKKTLKQNGVIELQNLQEVIDIVNRMKA